MYRIFSIILLLYPTIAYSMEPNRVLSLGNINSTYLPYSQQEEIIWQKITQASKAYPKITSLQEEITLTLTPELKYLDFKLTLPENNAISKVGIHIRNDLQPCFEVLKNFYIDAVYTLAAYRRKGYATKLLGYVLTFLKEQGVQQVELLSYGDTRSLYTKLGFDFVVKDEIYYRSDLYLMRKILQ